MARPLTPVRLVLEPDEYLALLAATRKPRGGALSECSDAARRLLVRVARSINRRRARRAGRAA